MAVFLLIGGIALYKTFALYEEKKEFNILQGRVPQFREKSNDLELAFLLDGKQVSTIPENPENYAIEFTCDNDEITGTWDSATKNVKVEGILTKATICTLSFESIAPTITLGSVTSNDISITIPYTVTGTEPITTTCAAGLEEGNYSVEGVIENNTCKLSNLQTGTTYYYKIEAKNNNRVPTVETGSIKTTIPSVSITGASSTTSSITLSFTTTGNITSKSCKCGSRSGSISGNSCTVSGLSGATTYSCSVTATNSSGYSVSASGNITTATPTATYNAWVCDGGSGAYYKTDISGSNTGNRCGQYCYSHGWRNWCTHGHSNDPNTVYCCCA